MALLDGMFDMSGNLGNFSIYKRKDLNKIIIRTKGGPSKEQIDNDPKCIRIKENSSELGACSKLTGAIRYATFPVRHLGDSKFTGALVQRCKEIQRRDTAGNRGERGLYLSRCRQLITNFNFNENHPFDNVVRLPVAYTTSRKQHSVDVTIRELLPGVHLFLPWKGTHYRFTVSIGAVNDVVFTKDGYPKPGPMPVEQAVTGWRHVTEVNPNTKVTLQLTEKLPAATTLLVCVGIEMGGLNRFGELATLRHAGAAKILTAF